MTQQFAKSNSINNSARCNHRFSNGMRCRLIGFGSQPFCPKHTQLVAPPPPDPAEIAATLTVNLDDFTSAAQINDFLRTLPAIAKEVNAEPTQIIFDMPGPDRTEDDAATSAQQHQAPVQSTE